MFDEETDRMFEQVEFDHKFSADELITISRLEWEDRVLQTTTKKMVKRVELLTRAVYIIGLLMMNRGFYAVNEILKFLSPKEFALVAAASDTILMQFFRFESHMTSRMFAWLTKEYNNKVVIPNMKFLCSLPNGQALRNELRVFKLEKNLSYVIDDFKWFPYTEKMTCAIFNPRHPIIAIQILDSFFVLAYTGEVRKKWGQYLYCLKTDQPQEIKWFSWNTTGDFLLVAFKEFFTMQATCYSVSFSVCKLIFFFSLSLPVNF